MISKSRNKFPPEPSQKQSRTETVVAVSAIAVLIIISAAVFYSQYRFNPAVKVWMVSRQAAEESGDLRKAENGAAKAGVDNSASGKILPLPPGFEPLSPPEYFSPETLSDKINGKAELYLPAGFKHLSAQRFRREDNPDLWFEVFAYNMGEKLNAFSVFSAQRRLGAESLSFAEYAYATENALF